MEYFESLKKGLEEAYAIASEARSKGFDPEERVEILVAKDVAARVEGLVGPPGIADIIRKMEAGGMGRTDIAFRLAEEISAGQHSRGTTEKLIEQAVRTAVGILTEGVLVAPTEGISQVSINENPDGTNYVSVFFAGPIRSAGGTVAALSVVFADIARRKCGIGNFRPTETEVARYIEEVETYENRCNHLQYKPPEEHVSIIVRNCPVCIDGDPTEEVEVSVHRDLERVKSNRVRGGIPLVICEGIAQKAPKVLKQAKKYGLDWDWLQDVIKVKKKQDKVEVGPDLTYLEGLVAGRPVFSYPMAKGGFRLRYGRSRTNGIMARNIHPAAMVLLDSFPANGTHMKVERPGKGCVVTVCDSIEPPVVKLKGGSVQKVKSAEEADSLRPQVEKILFLGDMLVTFGDFLKSNHPLMPSGYCREWWEAEIESRELNIPSFSNAFEAFEFSRKHDTPLHPDYTFPWHDLSAEEIASLAHFLAKGKAAWDGNKLRELVLPLEKEKPLLENLYIAHRVSDGKIFLSGDDGYSLLSSLGLLMGQKIDSSSFSFDPNQGVMENMCRLSGITIRRKSPTYIGGRMGRPEKAKERIMPGSPNILFPTGSPKNRSLMKIYKSLKGREKERGINVEVARFRCGECGKPTFSARCHSCGGKSSLERICSKCGRVTAEERHCDVQTQNYDYRPIEIVSVMEKVKSDLGFLPPDLKGVKGLFSDNRIPERLEKGFLRARHMVYVYKDGTCRFDATNAPLTHFRIYEINQTPEGIRGLGYEKDHLGKPIVSGDQVVALMPQDILVSRHGLEYMAKIARFIDDLLVNLYGLPPYYKIERDEELLGQLVVGLSPHTSACVLSRIIGYTDANLGYAHPYFHTAKRRNCDGDEDAIMLLMDALLNFSRSYLSTKRGGTMDAPLLLTPRIDPLEVDDEVHGMEVVRKYPLEFYEACDKLTYPGEIKLKLVKDLLGKPEEYGDLNFMFDTTTLNTGPMVTNYIRLDSIPEKIEAEFALHSLIRAVDSKDAAERLILSHFIPDIYGNLRSFSRQSFRCVDCNEIYRRPPLIGKCSRCGGKILLTINKGGIEKYLKVSMRMVEDYALPAYLKQRLELVEKEIKSVFEDEKIEQKGLSDFM